jgi:uncharacterized membrane-anchored protein
VTLGYDAVANSTGQLTSISNSNSATTYTAFDALGRVTASREIPEITDRGLLMLWTLLLIICFLVAIAGAVNSAEAVQANWIGYLLAIVAGSAVGACCVWALTRIANKVAASTSGLSSTRVRERYLGVLYVSTVLWMALAAITGGWLATAFMRFVK